MYRLCPPLWKSLACGLFRLISTGEKDYWHYLRSVMQDKLGFKSSRGDPDVWFCPSKRKTDGSPYYKYVLLYTDDILVISDNAEAVLKE